MCRALVGFKPQAAFMIRLRIDHGFWNGIVGETHGTSENVQVRIRALSIRFPSLFWRKLSGERRWTHWSTSAWITKSFLYLSKRSYSLTISVIMEQCFMILNASSMGADMIKATIWIARCYAADRGRHGRWQEVAGADEVPIPQGYGWAEGTARSLIWKGAGEGMGISIVDVSIFPWKLLHSQHTFSFALFLFFSITDTLRSKVLLSHLTAMPCLHLNVFVWFLYRETTLNPISHIITFCIKRLPVRSFYEEMDPLVPLVFETVILQI